VGEDARAIEETIRLERQELGRNIDHLQERTKRLTDWRSQYSDHAGVSLALAFGGGVALGLLARRSGSARSAYAYDRTAAPDASRPAGFNPLKAIGENPKVKRQVGEVWDEILESLITIASAKAVDLLGSVVPGFRDEFDARRHGRRVEER
jgi:hypothetical protein